MSSARPHSPMNWSQRLQSFSLCVSLCFFSSAAPCIFAFKRHDFSSNSYRFFFFFFFWYKQFHIFVKNEGMRQQAAVSARRKVFLFFCLFPSRRSWRPTLSLSRRSEQHKLRRSALKIMISKSEGNSVFPEWKQWKTKYKNTNRSKDKWTFYR